MVKKSITDEAKDLLSSWKNEIEERDGDILERKKQRDEQNSKEDEELKEKFKEVTEDLSGKAKKAFDVFKKEFGEFSQTVKEGTADIYKKAEVEKHAAQLLDFLNKVKSKGTDKFNEMTKSIKERFSDEKELSSEVENNNADKTSDSEIDSLIKQAQEEYEKSKK